MADTVEVILRLRGSRQFQSEAGKSAKALGGVTSSVGKMTAAFAGGAAVFAGVQKVTKDAVGNAVDLGEQMNKTAVVFRGPGAKAIQQWSKTTATALGISQRQALESAGVFGNMLVPMGFARGEAAKISQRMVALSADMASFNNASPEETLDAIRAGLAGESEPLRRYGVFLNDARLKQEAMNLGLKNAVGPNGALTANAKAQATLSLLTKDTSDAQGDFARTSSSLANQQRIMRAQYENMTATLGQKLLPILSFLVKNLDAVIIAVGGLTAAFLAYKTAALIATIQTQGLNIALAANPAGLVAIAIIGIVTALVILYKKCEWFRNAVNAVWEAIKTGASAAFAFVKKNWAILLTGLLGPIGLAAAAIIKNWDKIKQGVGAAIDWLMDKIGPLVDAVGKVAGVAGGVGGAVGGALSHIPHPHFATGGVMPYTGTAVVGERGPELVTLPRGATVFPTPAVAGIGAPPPLEPSGAQTIVTKVYLDRRQIAEAVGSYVADKRARR